VLDNIATTWVAVALINTIMGSKRRPIRAVPKATLHNESNVLAGAPVNHRKGKHCQNSLNRYPWKSAA